MIIVHIITRLVRGGADENTLLSCNGQVEHGHTVHLVVGRDVSEEMLKRLHSGVFLHKVSSLVREVNPLMDFSALFAIRRILRKVRPDILHTHTSKAGFLGRVGAFRIPELTVVHGVHILPFTNVGRIQALTYLSLEKIAAPLTDAYISVSDGMRDECLAHSIGSARKHFVVPSGMDVRAFESATPFSEYELKLNVPALRDRHMILIVAALEKRKRILETIALLDRVRSVNPDFLLVVLGEGEERDAIQDEIARRSMDDHVLLAGYQDNVERWIRTASICIFSSAREGLPRAVIQYAISGRPIVCTKLPGIEAVITHNENGILVDVDRLDDMESALLGLLGSADARCQMQEFASRRSFKEWSTTSMVDQIGLIYSQLAPDVSNNVKAA